MKKIGIIGSGTMGTGIALTAMLHGYDVLLFDVSREKLNDAKERISDELKKISGKENFLPQQARSIAKRLSIAVSLQQMNRRDLIIEAIFEDLLVKQELLLSLEKYCQPTTIFASNTSSLSISAIGVRLRYPERFLGIHFFNPVTRMQLVEIIAGARTSDKTIHQSVEFIKTLKKFPIVCNDVPGFIVNRVARQFYGEALRILGEGVTTVEEIDRIVRLEGNFKMGPFELMDLIGIDINFAVTQSIYEQTFHEPRYRPHRIQRQMVAAGKLGKKTGEGFYSYKK